MKSLEDIAMRQAAEIAGLSLLCKDLIEKLAQYTEVEDEEERLKKISEKKG
nr:MAG TPA: hypothetical protein [Caudoviricetes sp.]